MITRRKLISRTAIGTALLPFAQHMDAFAGENDSLYPKRFVFFTTGNGIDPSYLFPAVAPQGKSQSTLDPNLPSPDEIVDRSLAEVGLPPWLKSLEPLIDQTTCITGLSGKMCRGWHSVGFGTLGAYGSGDKGKPLMETIDGAFSRRIPGIFPHIGISVNGANSISAVGPGSALPVYHDPTEVYNNLYGVISQDPRAVRRNQFDGMLLDFMVDDVKAFEKRLPGDEKEKLAHYLDAYEQMSVRHRQLLEKRTALTELAPEKPTADLAWEDMVEAHCDMIAMAMIAGLTNVAAINTDGNGAGGAQYGKRSGFNQPTGGHGFGHGPPHRRVLPFGFNVSMMAKMAETLKSVPEGNGTMLDNTVLLMVSTSGSTHHTRAVNFPMILVGNCQGKMRMGRHIQIPKYGKEENRTIGSMYTTLLHAAGFPQDGFGTLDVSTTRANQLNPIPGLLKS